MADKDIPGDIPERAVEAWEAFDSLAPIRNRLHEIAAKISEYAGIPVPLEGEQLTVEPKYALYRIFQEAAEKANDEVAKDPDNIAGDLIRSAFWSTRYQRTIYTYWHAPTEKVRKVMLPGENGFNMALRTASISCVWGLEQEGRAVRLLGEMLPHHMLKSYLLTGMFVETSRRSGVSYVFRRLRPTVALRQADDDVRFLAALCMHPIGYYQGSWAGAMCPTDEIIAHLLLMRGDEPMYWRRCNQHQRRPEAGL